MTPNFSKQGEDIAKEGRGVSFLTMGGHEPPIQLSIKRREVGWPGVASDSVARPAMVT